MVKKSKWQTTVALATEGLPAMKIRKVIGVDKATMSRMLRVLTDLGYFNCENPRDKVKFYMPTDKKYSPDDDIVLSTMLQEKRRGINHTGCFIDCHAQAYTVRISTMGKEVRWDNEWQTRGCSHRIFCKTFTDIGPISFHRITGEFSDTLKISFSHIKWNVNRGSPERYLSNIARKVFGWFETEYDARLINMRKCTGDHYSIPVRDPGLVKAAQEKVIDYYGEFQLDASPPEKVPHFESKRGFDPLRRVLVYPDRVDALENRVDRLESEMAGLRQDMRVFMLEIRQDLSEIKKCFLVPVRPDDLRDVS